MAPRLMVILSTLALLAIGLVMVYSSSSITSYVEEGDALGETLKQCVFALLGIGIAVFVALVAKQDAMQGTPGVVFWALCCVLILVTALLGTVGLGAKRWLIIGPISIQISEFAKIAFVMMAARIAAQYREGEIDSGFAAKLAIGMVILPLGFVFIAQSDMGTTMICCIGLFSVVVLSGLSGRATAVLVGLGILFGLLPYFQKAIAPTVWEASPILGPMRRERAISWFTRSRRLRRVVFSERASATPMRSCSTCLKLKPISFLRSSVKNWVWLVLFWLSLPSWYSCVAVSLLPARQARHLALCWQRALP